MKPPRISYLLAGILGTLAFNYAIGEPMNRAIADSALIVLGWALARMDITRP